MLGNTEVTKDEFDREISKGVKGNIILNEPFFLDEILHSFFPPKNEEESKSVKGTTIDMSELKEGNVFKNTVWEKIAVTEKEEEQINKLKSACLNTKQYLGLEDVAKIVRAESEEELETILKRNMSIGKPLWDQDNTGGTVFEKVQNTPLIIKSDLPPHPKQYELEKAYAESLKRVGEVMAGKKDSQTTEKAPIFTYCKQMKNAVEALALRSLYGHKHYEKGDDWENFSRVENGDFEYSNAEFRHALGIGEDSEEEHLIASAWNSVARLEVYLRNKNK